MASSNLQLDITEPGQAAWTLAGWLRTCSTESLHTHAYHQLLTIRDGVSLLVDAKRKQPLFGAMAAFIPACLPHRSIVIGERVRYKSIYLAPDSFAPPAPEIAIFTISRLCAALIDRIEIRQPTDLSRDLNRECLDLLLKTLPGDMKRPADLVRLPEPRQTLTRQIIGFMETHYAERLTMADITAAFAYSGRQLSRRFKNDLKVTIFEYLRLYRILMAAIALQHPDRTVTGIAFDSGYESLSSFYRDFNLIFGVTPKAVRKQMLQSVECTSYSGIMTVRF